MENYYIIYIVFRDLTFGLFVTILYYFFFRKYILPFFFSSPVLAAAPDNIKKPFSKLIIVLLLIPIITSPVSYYLRNLYPLSFFSLLKSVSDKFFYPPCPFLVISLLFLFLFTIPVLAAAPDKQLPTRKLLYYFFILFLIIPTYPTGRLFTCYLYISILLFCVSIIFDFNGLH